MRIGQLTDTHYGRIGSPSPEDDAEALLAERVDVVVHTGDVSRGARLLSDLIRLGTALRDVPFLFVLGNHDYHESSFARSGELALEAVAAVRNARWLEAEPSPVEAGDAEFVGSGGWYSWGIWSRLTFDWLRIRNFRGHDKRARCDQLRRESSRRLGEQLEACRGDRVVVATHVPPFWEGRRESWDDFFWSDYDVDPDAAEAIQAYAESRRESRILVVSGHTHVEYGGAFDNVEYSVAAPRIRVHELRCRT